VVGPRGLLGVARWETGSAFESGEGVVAVSRFLAEVVRGGSRWVRPGSPIIGDSTAPALGLATGPNSGRAFLIG